MISYSQILGQLPQLIKAVEEYLTVGTRHKFLGMVEKFWEVLSKVIQQLPPREQVLAKASEMFDAWKKEN